LSEAFANLISLIENEGILSYLEGGLTLEGISQGAPVWAEALERSLLVLRITAAPSVKPARAREAAADVLAALWTMNLSLAYLINGTNDELGIYFSVFPGTTAPRATISQLEAQSVLECGYPWLSTSSSTARIFKDHLRGQWHSALVTGLPVFKPSTSSFGQIERIARGMVGRDWWLLLVAEPVVTDYVKYLRQFIEGEMHSKFHHVSRSIQNSSGEIEQIQDPLARRYLEDLVLESQRLEEGERRGLWSAWFTIGAPTHSSSETLQSLCKGVYSGSLHTLEPLMVSRIRPGRDTPSLVSVIHTLDRMNQRFQTNVPQSYPADLFSTPRLPLLLPCSDLATITRLPTVEMQGFTVENRPRFVADIPHHLIFNQMNVKP
jgi:hypothetical protein